MHSVVVVFCSILLSFLVGSAIRNRYGEGKLFIPDGHGQKNYQANGRREQWRGQPRRRGAHPAPTGANEPAVEPFESQKYCHQVSKLSRESSPNCQSK